MQVLTDCLWCECARERERKQKTGAGSECKSESKCVQFPCVECVNFRKFYVKKIANYKLKIKSLIQGAAAQDHKCWNTFKNWETNWTVVNDKLTSRKHETKENQIVFGETLTKRRVGRCAVQLFYLFIFTIISNHFSSEFVGCDIHTNAET